MRIHELAVASHRPVKRSGRGISGGRGKTAGRGTKGQNSRTGGGVRPGFEGGQSPLTNRLPKLPGFKTRRQAYQTMRLDLLTRVSGKVVDNVALKQAGLIYDITRGVKLVVGGSFKSAKTVKLAAASAAAIKLIEAAGGSFHATSAPTKVARSTSESEKS